MGPDGSLVRIGCMIRLLPLRARRVPWATAGRTVARTVVRCVLAYGMAALLATSTSAQPSSTDAQASAQRHAMMRLVAEGWRESQGADGLLPYGYDFLADRATDDPAAGGYAVREAAAFYAWGKYYRFSRDERYREPLQRGITALAQRSLPIGKSRMQAWLEAARILSAPAGRLTLRAALERFGLLYRPTGSGKVVSANGQYDGAWTGATALALLAELTYSQASGDDRFAELRSAWRDGLLTLRVPGRGFRERPTSIGDSDYFNGEAWLALAVYADLHRSDGRLAEALEDLDRALMRRYADHPSNEFYLWGAMAAAQRWNTTADPRFLAFLKQQARVFTDRFERQLDPNGNHCGPMEGLAATQGALVQAGEGRSDLGRRVESQLSRLTGELAGLQIQPGQTRMTLGGEAYLAAPALARFGGAFLFGRFRPETRVDGAQHCLSALLMIDENERLRSGAAMPPTPKQ